MITVSKLPEVYKYNLMNDCWEKDIQPKINEFYECIKKDMWKCIKLERKDYGSIVNRFGNWGNFIREIFRIVQLEYNEKYLFRKRLYYRDVLVGEYNIIWKINKGG